MSKPNSIPTDTNDRAFAPRCDMFYVAFPCDETRRARSVRPADVDPAWSARCAR